MGVTRVDNIPLWQCTECGKLYGSKEQAELCHKEYICENCGAKAPRYRLLCEKCDEQKTFDRANKMTYDEYIEKNPGNMIFYNGEYYSELEDLLDDLAYYEEDVPKYVYGTTKYRVEIDAQDVLDTEEENSNLEDFYFDDYGRLEFIHFVEEWNKKYGTDAYTVDYDTIILLGDDIKNVV